MDPNLKHGFLIENIVFIFVGGFANILKQQLIFVLQKTIMWYKLLNQPIWLLN